MKLTVAFGERTGELMTMKWILMTTGIVVFGSAIVIFIGQVRESTKAEQLVATLSAGKASRKNRTVDFAAFSKLPAPVDRYFQHVLTDGQNLIKVAKMQQQGVLRTSTATENWMLFSASQLVVTPATGFVWNAKVATPLGTHVRVLDSYVGGVGTGRVSFLSAFPVASESGAPALNSGALHRYLAEAVWFPTALLPQSGVVWSPIDEHTALATLTDRGTTVSLEFRFNEVGEVTRVYSPGRFGRFNGEYKRVPWQGHFGDYQFQAGMRVPLYGEVGWYDDGALQLVWKGHVTDVRYELER